MKVFAVLLAFLSCVFVACSPTSTFAPPPNNPYHPDHQVVYISDLFNQEETAEIKLALRILECDFEYKVVEYEIVPNSIPSRRIGANPSNSLLIEKVLSSDLRIEETDKEMQVGHYTVGLYLPQEELPTILLVANRIGDEKTFMKVIKHELLHQYLWVHSESTDSILYPVVEQAANDFTEYDLNRLRQMLHYSKKDFHLCHP